MCAESTENSQESTPITSQSKLTSQYSNRPTTEIEKTQTRTGSNLKWLISNENILVYAIIYFKGRIQLSSVTQEWKNSGERV